jgi:hypothetical protein
MTFHELGCCIKKKMAQNLLNAYNLSNLLLIHNLLCQRSLIVLLLAYILRLQQFRIAKVVFILT